MEHNKCHICQNIITYDITSDIYKEPYYCIEYIDSPPDKKDEISDAKILQYEELEYHTKIHIQSYIWNENLSVFPSHITHIIFNGHSIFNKVIDAFPAELQYLSLGNPFNQPLDNLPATLEYLELGHSFNQPLDNLPCNLKYLLLGRYFNQPLDNLPPGLVHLEITNKSCFNHPINNLPASLEHLVIGQESQFNHPLDNLPNNLKILFIGVWHNINYTLDNLPDSLEVLYLYEHCSGRYGGNGGYGRNVLNGLNDDNIKVIEKIISKLPKNIRYARIFTKYKYYGYLKGLYGDIID